LQREAGCSEMREENIALGSRPPLRTL
jgi:hypothetical protein